jgi:hypothetical protein
LNLGFGLPDKIEATKHALDLMDMEKAGHQEISGDSADQALDEIAFRLQNLAINAAAKTKLLDMLRDCRASYQTNQVIAPKPRARASRALKPRSQMLRATIDNDSDDGPLSVFCAAAQMAYKGLCVFCRLPRCTMDSCPASEMKRIGGCLFGNSDRMQGGFRGGLTMGTSYHHGSFKYEVGDSATDECERNEISLLERALAFTVLRPDMPGAPAIAKTDQFYDLKDKISSKAKDIAEKHLKRSEVKYTDEEARRAYEADAKKRFASVPPTDN